jgi:hypothetical protein
MSFKRRYRLRDKIEPKPKSFRSIAFPVVDLKEGLPDAKNMLDPDTNAIIRDGNPADAVS